MFISLGGLAASLPLYAATQLPPLTILAKKISPAFSTTQTSPSDLQTAQQTTVVDSLKQTPGLHVVQTGGVGKSAQVFVRGGNPEHVLVLIDGLRAHDPSSPHGGFDFGQLATESFQQIQVLRGPQTAPYGSQAVAGVVNLETARGGNPTTSCLASEIGSFQSYRQDLSIKGAYANTDFYLSAAHRQRDNPPSTPLAQRTLPRQGSPDPYDSQTLVSNIGLKPHPDWRLGLINRHQKSRSRYVNEFNINPNSQDIITYDLHGLTLTGDVQPYDWQPRLQIGLLQTHRHTGYDMAPFFPRSFYRGQDVSAQWQNQFHLKPDHTLHVGVETHHQSYQARLPHSESFDSFYRQTTAKGYESSANVGYQVAPHPRLKMDLWGRGHRHQAFKPHLTYRAAATYHHNETATDLYASYGTVMHPPSLYQLSDPYSGNRLLRPETGYGWEVGWQQRVSERIRIGSLFFQTRLHDLIVGQQISPQFYRYDNIKHSQTQGFESFISYDWQQDIHLRVDHLYTQAKDLGSGETLLRRPLHKILMTGQWSIKPEWQLVLSLSYDGKQVDRMRFPPYQKLYTTGPVLVRAALNYRPQGSWLGNKQPHFFARIENMLNRSYQQPAGYQQPGFGVYVGVRICA